MSKLRNAFSNIVNLPILGTLKRKIIIYVAVVAVILTADLVTKYIVEKKLVADYVSGMELIPSQGVQMYLGKRLVVTDVVVIPNFWSFSYVRNYGIGFSADRFLNKYFTMDKKSKIVGFVQLLAVLLAIIYLVYTRFEYLLPFMLVTAGGLGNVVDRFYRGYVVDFVKWYIPGSPIEIFNPWPLFNIADFSITIGGFLLLISILLDILSPKTKAVSS